MARKGVFPIVATLAVVWRGIGGVLPDGDAGLEYQYQYHDNRTGVCGFEREDETHRGTGSICKPAAA